MSTLAKLWKFVANMSLNFEITSCVRASSKLSSCTQCVDICPVDTIGLVDNIPSFSPSACVECGACVGACPSSAFSLSQYRGVDFFFEFLEQETPIISCKQNVPCLAWFGVEELMALALSKEIVLELGYCKSCEIGKRLYTHIVATIEEANFVLSSFCDKTLKVSFETSDRETQERRNFLSNITLQKALKAKEEFEARIEEEELKSFAIDSTHVAKLKTKTIPLKRQLLLTLLKRVEKPAQYEILPQKEISFISQKYIDERCTNCQICYRICPTGALSSNAKFSLIHFDTLACIKCHLCHDVCEPNAIELQIGFENQEFFEPRKRTLIAFDIRRCNECGNSFTYRGGETICPRCQIEEEESLMLHHNAVHPKHHPLP